MVEDRQVRTRRLALPFALALIALVAGCKKPAPEGEPGLPDRPADCKPPSEEQLAEFVRLQSEGVELYKKKQTASAITKFESAQKINPCDVSIYNDLGITFHQQRKVKQAIEYLKRGIEIDPLYPLSYLNLGIVYDELANFDEAVKAFGEFIKLSPDFEEAHRRLGGVYFKMSRYEDAARCMEKATQLKPDGWEPWYTLGNIAFHDKDFEKASSHYAKTLELNPNYSEALYKQGTTLQRLGREEEAAVYLEKFKKLSVHQERIDDIQRLLSTETDRKHDLYVALGRETMQVGLYEEAIDSFQKSLKAKPDNIDAFVGLADCYRHQKKFAEGLEAAAKAKEIDPTFVAAYDSAMAIYNDQGKYDLATREVTELLQKKPDYPDGLLNLGMLEQRSGHFTEAIAALEKYLEQKPNDLLAHEVLLSIFTQAATPKFQDKKKAMEHAKVAEKLGSKQFEFMAEAYHMNGDRQKAIALLEQGLQDPQHPMAEIMRAHVDQIRKEGKAN